MMEILHLDDMSCVFNFCDLISVASLSLCSRHYYFLVKEWILSSPQVLILVDKQNEIAGAGDLSNGQWASYKYRGLGDLEVYSFGAIVIPFAESDGYNQALVHSMPFISRIASYRDLMSVLLKMKLKDLRPDFRFIPPLKYKNAKDLYPAVKDYVVKRIVDQICKRFFAEGYRSYGLKLLPMGAFVDSHLNVSVMRNDGWKDLVIRQLPSAMAINWNKFPSLVRLIIKRAAEISPKEVIIVSEDGDLLLRK